MGGKRTPPRVQHACTARTPPVHRDRAQPLAGVNPGLAGSRRDMPETPMQSKRTAQHRAMTELERLQTELEERWIDGSLPEDWQGLFFDTEIDPPKTRVTIRLDADMVRWFRKMGPNYSRLINRVLRVYWTALMAGHIKAYFAHDTTPQLLASTRAILEEREKRR